MRPLTEKQLRALRAVADPDGALGRAFWLEANTRGEPTAGRPAGRPYWPGLRRTLGSLIVRGLIDYGRNGWYITPAGSEELRKVDA